MIRESPIGSPIGQDEMDAVRRVVESGEPLTRGKDVELFENEFAQYCGSKYAVAVSSCTSALRLSTQLLHLKKGDEVIVQDNCFWAMLVPLLERGVRIVCCDIERDTLNIDVDRLDELVTPDTKSIYLMHHGGNPADMSTVMDISEDYDVPVVEDAAHAVGTEHNHKKIGSFSDITCFSFSTLKNMTTLGEGGMITTNNKEYKEMLEGLRTCYPFGSRVKRNVSNLGRYNMPKSVAFMHMGDSWEYDWTGVDEYGSGYRMSTVQAAVGRVQLKKLDEFISKRKSVADRYNEFTEGFDRLYLRKGDKHAWHLYSFFTISDDDTYRDWFIQKVNDFGLEIVIRFYPIHLGGIMRMDGHTVRECHVCEDVWFHEQLALPISPTMSTEEVDEVGEIIERVMK